MFSGNLTRDPELKFLERSGTHVCNFSIAMNRKYKKANGESAQVTTYVDCVAWDTGAEAIAKHFKKGNGIEVQCSVENEYWETKEGAKRSALKFRVKEFGFPISSGRSATPATEEASGPQEDEETTSGGDEDDGVAVGVGAEEEIPF